MSKYYNPQKAASKCFDPQSSQPFRFSRSKIDSFLKCPRCFYLENRLGVAQPPPYPFSLNIAVDALMKKEFDIHRVAGVAHPLMQKYGIDAIPLQHAQMDNWRELQFGRGGVHYLHPGTNFDVYGVVDDIWLNPAGEFIVVDYKATSKAAVPTLDGDLGVQYRRQMEVYQWLLAKNNFKVSKLGYFVYVNGKKDVAAFDAKLEFDLYILPCDGDNAWVEPTLIKARKCLISDEIPAANEECDYCQYRFAVARVESQSAKRESPSIGENLVGKKVTKKAEKPKTVGLF